MAVIWNGLVRFWIWHVVNKDQNGRLGSVRWFGRWRKYAFYPEPSTVFEEVCMRDIACFIVDRTREHREARQNATASLTTPSVPRPFQFF